MSEIDFIAPENSNKEIRELIKSYIQNQMWQTLTFLEIALPHTKGDGSENENKFSVIRTKVLRIGNDSIRNLDSLFDSIVTLKLFDYEKVTNQNLQTEIFEFSQKVKVLNKERK